MRNVIFVQPLCFSPSKPIMNNHLAANSMRRPGQLRTTRNVSAGCRANLANVANKDVLMSAGELDCRDDCGKLVRFFRLLAGTTEQRIVRSSRFNKVSSKVIVGLSVDGLRMLSPIDPMPSSSKKFIMQAAIFVGGRVSSFSTS